MNHPGNNHVNEDAIEAMAAGWLAERDAGFVGDRPRDFEKWKGVDPRHAAALARLEATCRILGQMPQLKQTRHLRQRLAVMARPQPRRAPVIRFPWWRAVSAAAAALILGTTAWWLGPGSAGEEQDYATAAEGFERFTLSDGSVVELNSDSAIHVRYSKSERGVILDRGEAHFSVAKNPTRPFIVSANKITVRAVGTAFNVRLETSAVEVLVTEGKVRVSRSPKATTAPSATPARDAELKAGQRIFIGMADTSAAPVVETMNPDAVRELLAWQAPQLVFVETPLTDVVAQFNRHNRVQLSLGDPELAKRPVDGRFRADHVEAFVRLLESTRDLSVERPDANHIVLRNAK